MTPKLPPPPPPPLPPFIHGWRRRRPTSLVDWLWSSKHQQQQSSRQRNHPVATICRVPITPCCITVKCRRWCRAAVQYGLLAILFCILILWMGTEAEDRRVQDAADTLTLYTTHHVCAMALPATVMFEFNQSRVVNHTMISTAPPTISGNETESGSTSTSSRSSSNSNMPWSTLLLDSQGNPVESPRTFSSLSDLEQWNANAMTMSTTVTTTRNSTTNDTIPTTVSYLPMHCGDCGHCSNPADIRIYDQTRNTLFATTVDCAKWGFIGGRRLVKQCMEGRTGFTSPCNQCWVENIMCDLRHCVFTCMWHGLFDMAQTDKTATNKQLNRCTACDEKICGPAFVTCAGVNRRRAGIVSQIDRDMQQEVCTAVPSSWWDNNAIQSYYQNYQNQQQKQLQQDTSGEVRRFRR